MTPSRLRARGHSRAHCSPRPPALWLRSAAAAPRCARPAARAAHFAPATGTVLGTPRYMPPEQIRGEDDIDGRLDLYALGCILFEMVSGQVPFEGPDFAAIFEQHLENTPPRLDVVVGNCPTELADLVDKLLEKSPQDRPASAGEVAEALECMLSGTTSASALHHATAVKTDFAGDLVAPVANLTERLHGGPIAEDGDLTRRVLALCAAALAVILGIALAMNR